MRVAIQKKFTHNFKLASPLGYIKGFGDPKRLPGACHWVLG